MGCIYYIEKMKRVLWFMCENYGIQQKKRVEEKDIMLRLTDILFREKLITAEEKVKMITLIEKGEKCHETSCSNLCQM